MDAPFGSKLRGLRVTHALSQQELANLLALADGTYAVTRSTIANIERNHDEPGIDLVLRVAKVFRVSTDYLLRNLDDAAIDRTSLRPHRFGTKLQVLRKAHGISQNGLATALNLESRASVSNMERGARFPGTELLVHIADYFSIPIDLLVDDERELPQSLLSPPKNHA